ncbi:MAG: DUF104 domain-containing protein [Acidobacteria bacterium]|nr:DUF104 domain-containing protein [Acidobacteriota bacterium]MBM3769275.1 DUF104 domain-containing protein [Acidobacteriota bacterium]
MKRVEAQFENGVFRPDKPVSIRPGERVSLIVLQHPDPRRWDMARISETSGEEDLLLAEQGLAEWANALDAKNRD